MALKAKNKLAFIDGSLTRPAVKEDEEFFECHAWNMVNCMLCSWLLNVTDPKLRMTINGDRSSNVECSEKAIQNG